MTQYRSKPSTCEAIQLRWKNWQEVCSFLGGAVAPEVPAHVIPESEVSSTCGEFGPDFIALDVTTIHGEKATVRHGDYIVREPGARDRFYPVKPDIFERRWEEITEPQREVGIPRSSR